MGALIAAHDWSATPLGPISCWPQSVKTTISLILRNPAPMTTLWGKTGVMIYNEAYAVMAEDRHPDILGAGVLESWPEAADFNRRVLETCLAGGGTLSFRDQELTLNRNGRLEQVWLDLDYSSIVDESGAVTGALALVQETTKRVRAEHLLRSEEERLRLMFEQAPGFMVLLSGPEHRIAQTNPGYLHLVGGRDVLGQTVRDALPDAVEQGYLDLLDQAFRTGEAYSARASRYAVQVEADGPIDERFLDFVIQPIRAPSTEVIGIFVLGHDVTDRIAAENAAHAGEAQHRQILDGVLDYAIIASDLEGRVTRWNEGARRVFGWSEAEMLGQPLDRVFVPEERADDRPAEERRTALAAGYVRNDGWRERKTGERFWATGEMTPLRDEAGQPIGFVKVVHDRTQAHRDEEALKAAADQLRRAQEAGGVGLFTVELADNLLRGTPQFFRIFGIEPAETVPASELERLVIDQDAQVVSTAEGRRAGTAALDVEYRIRRPDGEERTISRKGEFERDAEGRPVRMVGVVQDVTERRKVQSALEQSEAEFRGLAQAMPNQVWTSPPNGRLDWFNDRVYAYSGLSEGELDGDGWATIVHPEDRAAATERWTSSLATGEVYETEFRLRDAQGAYRWHLARALPLRNADGEISRWVGTNTDIHERRLAEAANAADRARMWNMSQDLLLVSDRQGRITAVNPSATRLLGWTEAEMVGKRLTTFVHPDDLDSTLAVVATLANGASMLTHENRFLTKDGDHRLLDWTAVADGDRIHGVGRDITYERAVARDQERIWTLSPVLKVVASSDGRISKVNPAWTRSLGWTFEDAVGRDLFSFVTDDRQSSEVLKRLRSGRPVSDYQLDFATRDGDHRQISWTLVREAGAIYGFGRDVSDQRAAEEALRQAQKMEAVGQLTGGIAHDFNNLLQGITGSLDLIQKRVAQGRIGELDRFISGAMTSANRASALTHRLLAFSRRQPLDPRPVRANPLMTSMEDLLRRTLGERIEVELVLAGGLWLTRCDPNQLESAILNLAINARDAMPDGGKLVIETCNAHLDRKYAALQRDVRPGQYVCICVTDTGTGMAPDIVARAFEPFFTTKPIGQGTGLGLSMIYGFAQQSEGYVKIYSEPGQGTTVKLYLPRFRGDAEDDEASPQLISAHAADKGETVLVVEDEPVVRGLIVEVLNDLGYHAIEAADGPQGLEILQSGRKLDLLITDIGLPGLNGRQVADAGRQLRPEIKVLFMTGYAENAALASGFLEPGMAMVTKPFAMEALSAQIREILNEG